MGRLWVGWNALVRPCGEAGSSRSQRAKIRGAGGFLARALERVSRGLRWRELDPRAAEGRFQQVVEAAPSAMLMIDSDRTITLVNRRTEALFGYARSELLGEAIDKLVPERYRQALPLQLSKFLEDPQARPVGFGREFFGLRKDGTEVPIEIELSPIDTPDGICVLASAVDVTERRRAEEWFQRVVQAAPNAKVVVNRQGQITLVNRSAELLFGYSQDELLGQSLDCLLPERARRQHSTHMQAFHADAKVRPMGAGRDLYGCHKDGTEIPIEIGLSPIEAPGGMATLASIIDITERKRSENELRRSNAELEQFAYVASHDLQEPLRMVANYTELLAERYRGQLDQKADKYIHYASDGAQRMQQLVADLLAYSRIGSQGKPPLPVDSGVVLGRGVESLQALMQDAFGAVEYGPLPTVLADEVQLGQLFQNLVGNAMKFRSEAPPKVSVRAVAEGDRWHFSFADNGIGIDMQYADRIFQMFQRLHAIGQYEGSGIGLAISKRIVERHGGRIWVESQPGAGTTFHFTLRGAQQAKP